MNYNPINAEAGGFTQAFAPAITKMGGYTLAGKAQRTLVSAVVGGTASVLGGGKFANGALTGAFSRLFNDEVAEHRNPARSMAGNALKDGRLTLSEANQIWRTNNDPNFEVTVDASQLTVRQTENFGINGTAPGVVEGRDWFVHGSVTLQQASEGIRIQPESYDFLPRGSLLDNPIRNIETYGGFYIASRAGTSVGTDFLIRYSGQPNVVK